MTRLPKCSLSEPIESLYSGQVLREAGFEELRVVASQIIPIKDGIRPHPSGQEASTQRAVTQHRNITFAAIGQQVGLDAALKQVVGRLQHMQRRHAAKLPHLANRKIAHPDGADFPLPEQRVHRLCGFFDRNQWVRP